MNKIIDARTIVDEVASESVKLYNDNPYLTIFQAIGIVNKIIEIKYKDFEIVESD